MPDLPERSFVKHRNDAEIPAGVRFEFPVKPESTPRVSILIPTIDGVRGGHLPQLLSQLHSQSFQDFEVIVIYGEKRQGRAINCGAALARGDVLVTFDDDSRLGNVETLKNLLAGLDADAAIGAAGGANLVLSDAPWIVRRVMLELPRRSSPPVDRTVDSDLAEHPCLAMRKHVFMAAGGENELIPRGLDPYLRQQIRDLGYRVVVVPGVIYHHLPPARVSVLVRQFFRNGAQSRLCSMRYPQWVYDTLDEHGAGDAPLTPLHGRVLRFAKDLGRALLEGRFIYILCHLSYAAGWLHESLTGSR